MKQDVKAFEKREHMVVLYLTRPPDRSACTKTHITAILHLNPIRKEKGNLRKIKRGKRNWPCRGRDKQGNRNWAVSRKTAKIANFGQCKNEVDEPSETCVAQTCHTTVPRFASHGSRGAQTRSLAPKTERFVGSPRQGSAVGLKLRCGVETCMTCRLSNRVVETFGSFDWLTDLPLGYPTLRADHE